LVRVPLTLLEKCVSVLLYRKVEDFKSTPDKFEWIKIPLTSFKEYVSLENMEVQDYTGK